MRKDIREQLLTMKEMEYQKFSSALIPGVKQMLGIRLPELRKLAKQIVKTDWKKAIQEEDEYFEERMLHGMVLSYVKADWEEIVPYITEFIALVDNWSVCDSVFMGMTVFQQDREKTWEYIQSYVQSDQEVEIRVALIIMMQHLLKCDEKGKKRSRLRVVTMQDLAEGNEKKGLYLERIFTTLNEVDTRTYYAHMAAAWLLAEAFCCFPYYTYKFLQENNLADRTYNKAIQKIVESHIPTEEVKIVLRGMKR